MDATLADARRVEAAKPLELRGFNKPTFRTNDGFILNLINVSPFGSLGTAFVLEAIRHYSTTVAAQELGEETEEDKNAVLSKHTWRRVAVDVRDRVTNYLNTKG